MVKNGLAFSIIVASLIFSSCGGTMWGDNDLGDNFSLFEGDGIEDRVIVYCSGRSGGSCMAGTPIVPVYSRQMDTGGHYAEYVETAKSNNSFIIAKTFQIKNKTTNYWIISKDFKITNCDKINCDSIIQSHVIGPLSKIEFKKQIFQRKINLGFGDD
jgi:hypothetical protein